MDTFLDIQELVKERRKHENGRLQIFKTVLQQCYNIIKRYNKEKIYEMDYKIPLFVLGCPKYDIDALKNYLLYHLKDNGLKVIVLKDGYTLYISWKETDIDLEKYLTRKRSMEQNLCMDQEGMPRQAKTEQVSLSTLKYRQEKQRQLQEARQNRFENQRERWPVPPSRY